MMIDTHSHIYGPEFDDDRAEVLQRARLAGVDKVLLPNINEESIARMLQVAKEYPDMCYPMMGLHPEDVKEDWAQVLDRMEMQLDGMIAVGEVGLDFYWDTTFRKEQIEAFERQICWAVERNLPLVIHMRKAEQELLEVMERHKSDGLRGVFHCFGGSRETASRMLKHEGFVLGIGGVVTFKNSRLAETLRHVPLDRIVLETDAPYLAPVPYRGKRNEPSYVAHVARFLSDIYNVSEEEVNDVTNLAVKRVFGSL
ncbi:MAG: TatD family hydrolase [Bacteroidaceae bacterium]|nr:TatD family hydrolase [Bacteroidaceae bacterium]MBO5794924.1 TatD family hydrolase [Bacteroidaceae bacterium]